MTGVRQRLLGLVLPAVPFWLLDVTLTLAGQHPGYWQGYYWEPGAAARYAQPWDARGPSSDRTA